MENLTLPATFTLTLDDGLRLQGRQVNGEILLFGPEGRFEATDIRVTSTQVNQRAGRPSLRVEFETPELVELDTTGEFMERDVTLRGWVAIPPQIDPAQIFDEQEEERKRKRHATRMALAIFFTIAGPFYLLFFWACLRLILGW